MVRTARTQITADHWMWRVGNAKRNTRKKAAKAIFVDESSEFTPKQVDVVEQRVTPAEPETPSPFDSWKKKPT